MVKSVRDVKVCDGLSKNWYMRTDERLGKENISEEATVVVASWHIGLVKGAILPLFQWYVPSTKWHLARVSISSVRQQDKADKFYPVFSVSLHSNPPFKIFQKNIAARKQKFPIFETLSASLKWFLVSQFQV